MVQNGFESRVKVQQIIDSQLPEFILDESPKASEFLKQYYISQEYQGGPTDIVENLDQYINLDGLIPEVVEDNIVLSNSITETSSTIEVTSTKGFPAKYGLLKIDNEIITYTGSTETSFTGCIRGFSGITNYHKDLQYGELVFSESVSSSHPSGSKIQNLSSLFLHEFYKKIKFSLTPGLDGVDFVENLNVGNFIKNSRSLYDSKGTPESFRILFNVLFGETPQVLDLENFLIKPSDASFIRRNVALVDVIYGDPTKLIGQTIKKSTDESTSASVSEVETVTKKGKTYYKLNFFIGYDDTYPNITGTFDITANTRVIDNVIVEKNTQSVVTVDSTIGFQESGSFFFNEKEIFYTEKTINQFLGCYVEQLQPVSITKTSRINSNQTYYGYEDGDLDKKVEFVITGILSDLVIESDSYFSVENDEILPQNVGEIISKGNSRKEIFANSLIYNTSSRYQIDSFSGNTLITKSPIDNTSLKVGDKIEVLERNTENLISEFNDVIVRSISSNNEIEINVDTSDLNSSEKYDLRRKINKAKSAIVPIKFGNDVITSDVQNLYNQKSQNLYVASNSLPSYEIQKNVFEYEVVSLDGKLDNEEYSIIDFGSNQVVSFITGDKVFYYTDEESTIPGLEQGIYYVQVDDNNRRIKLYSSSSTVGSDSLVSFGLLSNGIVTGSHKFILYSQRSKLISPQKLLKKFTLNPSIGSVKENKTLPGPIGILNNGVEIYSYKTNDKIYYGPLENVTVLSGGEGYDVINPPLLTLSEGDALVQPVVSGSVEKIYVDPQDFDINVIISINLTGGNGSGSSFEPILEKYAREIEFDARPISSGGGLDDVNERIAFLQDHNLINGQAIVYSSNNFSPLGIATFGGSNLDQSRNLINDETYYAEVINNKTIQIYENFSDYSLGINTVGFNTVGNFGTHKFKTEVKNRLSGIKVINGGSGYTNRKLRVSPQGISTHNHTIEFENHGFSDGELVTYGYQIDEIVGLSTLNQYKVIKIDSDRFRLCDAGIDGTNVENYERKNYIKFSSKGTGYQIFSYPDISLSVEYTYVGIESIQGKINATPIIRGSIKQVYVYENGQDYGSLVLNSHQRPNITIKNGKESQLKPIISNGRIIDVIVLYGGVEYYSTPELVVTGKGFGATLRPVISNNKIIDVIVINSGVGYDDTTTIQAVSAGKNAVLQSNIRSLTLDNSYKYGIQNEFYRDPAAEILVETKNNLQYAVVGYSTNIKDSGGELHSDIIGWAYDGNPIYGPYGYSDPDDTKFVKKLETGYSLSSSNVENRPSEDVFPLGYFIEDYKFTNNGDLDQYNGRFGKTKDFPNGTYAYFASVQTNDDNIFVGKFPYFVGDEYRSDYIEENLTLNQSFNFNESDLIRNTLPYKVNDNYADNDFIVESNELIKQKTVIESVSSGSVSGLKIINAGSNYAVNDEIIFDSAETGGGGILVNVSEVFGKKINEINTTTQSYQNSAVTWENGNTIKVNTLPYHEFLSEDVVNISGLSTEISSLNGSYKINLKNYTTILDKDIPDYSTTGNVTDVYLTSIPDNISVGSSFKIDDEIFLILNIYKNYGVVRVSRNIGGGSHIQSSIVYFLPNSFTINKSINYFESKLNSKVHYNPTKSVGIGTTSGSGINVSYAIGDTNYDNFIPTQSIFIPNHPFKTGQEVVFRRPSSATPIAVSDTGDSSSFNILDTEYETLYVINKSKDYIGIATNATLATSTNGLFFRNNIWTSSSDDYRYSIESNYNQISCDVNKINSVVSVSTSHNLNVGDIINLDIKPGSTVGVGTSSSINVKYSDTIQSLIVNSVEFYPSGINTSTNQITINSHGFKNGDKILYESNTAPTGIHTGSYYVYVVDNDTIKLCETYSDSLNSPPISIDITSVGVGIQTISLINPQIKVIKNNNIKFDLTDTSLSEYNFKIYYDKEFTKEFISVEGVESLSISGIGSVGISTDSSLTINYSDNIPEKLYYNVEKSGYISTADFDVKNYSEIVFVESTYNGNHNIIGVADTTFTISLNEVPEKLNYNHDECDLLEYSTNSTSTSGGIKKLDLLSGGYGYKSLPLFVGSNSVNGDGANIVPYSTEIGKITQSRIVNEGFEYSSDRTLRPTASIPKNVYLYSANKLDFIEVISGGKNYTSAPDLVIVNSDTGELIDSGLLKVDLIGSSIGFVNIEIEPKGLPDKDVTIRAINNSNGITIDRIESSSSGIVTCTITTPLAGFTSAPFSVGDKIFVEGIEKNDSSGDGFNSSDYGYKFFTVKNYYSSGPDRLEFDISEFTTNPGIAKTIQESYATIINYNDYPEFKVTQVPSEFLLDETLLSDNGFGFIVRDLVVVSSKENSIRVRGSYKLSINEKIKGLKSLNEGIISDIEETNAIYNVSYFNKQNFGWKNQTGKLNEDSQVIPDNDYYQNLSYTVKSSKTWEEIVTPVNNLLHTSGTKNFSDTQFSNSVQSGIGSTSIDSILSITSYFVEDTRVDTINNLDLVVDLDVVGNKSNSIKFENIRLSDYILCKTNRSLKIDDISSQFSSSDDERSTVSNILPLSRADNYNKFLVQVRNTLNNEIQFSELITISNDNDIFTLNKADFSTGTVGYGSSLFDPDLLLADIRGYVDESGSFYLRFEPEEPFNPAFDIKILHDKFIGNIGVTSTQDLKCVNLIGKGEVISGGITTSILEVDSSNYSAIYSNIYITNNDGSDMNYVEIYLTHDETNTYLSEYYFDNKDEENSKFIGSFGSSLSNGILSLTYTNTESDNIIIKNKSVGFGSTSLGEDSYRFKVPGQTDGSERTVILESNYTNVSSGSTVVFTADKQLFTSIKSVVKVGLGETSSLHQMMIVYDGSNVYDLQYPFISVGSTSGIGTFGTEVDSSNILLKFYPDVSTSGNIEIISFNEYFYKDLDTINTPSDLNYSLVNQSVKTASYFGVNYPLSNTLEFETNYENSPIFMKTFNPLYDIDFETGKCTLPNHFFNTGEELIYRPKSSFVGVESSPIGIGATENYIGIVTTLLPEIVYAIREDENTIRISTKKEYALQGIGVTFTSIGIGNAHELEMYKKNEKSLITINNLVQHPISYSYVTHTLSNNGGQIGIADTVFALSGISSIKPTDLLKIDDEYVKVENVGLGTTNVGPITFSGDVSLVEVVRGFAGSNASIHSDSSIARVYRGSYNISGNKIYFTEPPRGNQLDSIGPNENALKRERATFSGRVFLRQDYTSNQLYDDISDQFTGIGQTFTLTSQGINTVGLGTSGGNGIVFINSIFQSPTTLNNSQNNYIINEDTVSGITSITFTGIKSDVGVYTSEYDINMNQLPRGGIIVSLGSTSGLGYAPLVGASVTAIVGAGGSIVSVGLGAQDILGSGYRGNVSINIVDPGHSGDAASITASVGSGGTLSFNIVDGGSGYSDPTINVSSPSYENLPVIGVSRLGIGATTETGIGLLLNVEVRASSTTGIGSTLFEVSNFKISRNGYGFRRGDVFKPVGLVTGLGLESPISEFELTVLDTFTDSFAAWQFGELDYIDSIKNYQNGIRKRFPLFYNSELLSFEVDDNNVDSQPIDLDSVLVIFVNGILQEPGTSYQFSGGTSFTFTVAPKEGDDVAIFFYRGTRGEDSELIDVTPSIKVGDTVQVFSNNQNLNNTITQNERFVYSITGSDKIQTNLYNSQGIDDTNLKPLYWTKQKVDLIINGDIVSKSRDSIESQIYPTSNIIADFNINDSEIFVDDASLFDYEEANQINFDAIIFSNTNVGIATTDFSTQYETITNITSVQGFDAFIVGISATTGIGAPLGIKFNLSREGGIYPDIQVGYPVYISGITVGSGVTSINSSDSDIVAISTSYLNNVYKVHAFDSITGVMTCNVASNTNIIGIATTGTQNYPVGRLSWGRLSGFTRSTSPISIAVTGYTSSLGISSEGYNSGISTYPIIQRRGYGLRNNGSLVRE